MKPKPISLYLLLAAIGLIITGIGILGLIMNWLEDLSGIAVVMLGCALFGYNLGMAIHVKSMAEYPKVAREIEIERKDERTILIAKSAKSKAFDAMIYIYAALALTYALINVDYIVIGLLVIAFVLVIGIMLFHLNRLNKSM